MRDKFLSVIYGLVILNSMVTGFLVLQLIFFQPRSSASFPIADLSDNVELQLLRAQLEATQRYHGDVLATLWGALASIATVIVVVTVLGNLQSRRIYERDVESLKDYAQKQASTSENQLRLFIEDKARELLESARAETTTQAEKLRVENASALTEAIASSAKQLEARIELSQRELWRLGIIVSGERVTSLLRDKQYSELWTPLLVSLRFASQLTTTDTDPKASTEGGILDTMKLLLEHDPTYAPTESLQSLLFATLSEVVHSDNKDLAESIAKQIQSNLARQEAIRMGAENIPPPAPAEGQR